MTEEQRQACQELKDSCSNFLPVFGDVPFPVPEQVTTYYLVQCLEQVLEEILVPVTSYNYVVRWSPLRKEAHVLCPSCYHLVARAQGSDKVQCYFEKSYEPCVNCGYTPVRCDCTNCITLPKTEE